MFGSCTGGARHVAKMDHTHLPRERNAIVYLYICMSSLAGWRGTVILFGDGPTQHPEPTLLQHSARPTDTWAPVRPQHSNPTAGENRSHYHSTALVQVQQPSGRRPPSGRRRRGIISHPRRPLLRHLPLTAAGPPLGLPSSTFLSIWHLSPPFPFHWIGR